MAMLAVAAIGNVAFSLALGGIAAVCASGNTLARGFRPDHRGPYAY
jgi:hypothetical protein